MGYNGDKRLNSKSVGGSRKKKRGFITWSSVPADLLASFVRVMVTSGRAILLAETSTGNALTVRVYDDGDSETYYIRAKDPIRETLSEIASEYTDTELDGEADSTEAS